MTAFVSFFRRHLPFLFVAVAFAAFPEGAHAQTQPILFTEAPAGSGFFNFLVDGEFTAKGAVSEWSLDAETGDLLTVRVEAEGATRPKIRILNSSGGDVASVNGGSDGIAWIQRHLFTTPGTYRIRVYSDHLVAPFQLRVDLGRSIDLEVEPNGGLATASPLASDSVAGGFFLRAGGVLHRGDSADWYRIGQVSAGNEVEVNLSRAASSLDTGEARISLFREGLEEELAEVNGDQLSFSATEADTYFARISPNWVGGSALRFDGDDDVAYLPEETVDGASDLTVEFWLKTTETGKQVIVSAANEVNDNVILIYFPSSTRLDYFTGEGVSDTVGWSIPSIADGAWRHFSLVRDQAAGEVRFYINGVSQGAQTTVLSTLEVDAGGFLLGQDQDDVGGGFDPRQALDGELDELRIWRSARSEEDIGTDFENLLTGNETGLAGYWQFNEGSGTSLVDISPHGRDGTFGPEETRPVWVDSTIPVGPSGLLWGLEAQYFLSVEVADSVPPGVVATTLPNEGEAGNDIFNSFTVTFSEDMDVGKVSDIAHYELRHAGADEIFGTGDDHVHSLNITPVLTGKPVQVEVLDGPLQPGELRLTISPGVTDRAGNPLSPAFVRSFEVEELDGFRFETIGNHSRETATSLGTLREEPVGSGIHWGGGRGHILATGSENYDYWTFEGTEGDRIIIASESVGNARSTGLRYSVQKEGGQQLVSLSTTKGSGQSQTILPETGTYFVQVRHHYAYYGEYRFRVTLAPAPWMAENENNDSTNNANSLRLALEDGFYKGKVFGHIHVEDARDVFAFLPVLENGDVPLFPLPELTEIRIQQSRPASSSIEVNLEILDPAGAVVASGEPGAPSLSYTIPLEAGGRYYLRATATAGTEGLTSQYMIEVELEIPADVVLPEVVSTTLPTDVSTGVIDRFQLTFSEDLSATSVNDLDQYEVRGAGSDGVFDTADDVLFTLTAPSSYESGLTFDLQISEGPLQPDSYRFTVSSTLQDRAGNAMAADYVQLFSTENQDDYVLELQPNEAMELATNLSPFPAGDFDGSFETAVENSMGEQPYSVQAADLDGDGQDDLVMVLRTSNKMRVLLGNGDGTFAESVDYSVGSDPIAIHLADLTGNGELDAAVVSEGDNTLSLLINDGDGAFGPAVSYPVGSNPNALAVGDIDGDGALDVVVANRSGASVSLFLGNGDGTLTEGTLVDVPGSQPRGVGLGDFDGDGKLDLVFGDYNNDVVSVHPGNGDGTFGAATTHSILSRANALAVADLDGDGLADIVVVHESGSQMSLLRASGGGDFEDSVPYTVGDSGASYEVKIQDIDGDGRPDLLVSGRNEVMVRYNRGDFVFDLPARYRAGSTVRSATVGDFNADGRTDLAVVSSSSRSLWLLFGRGARFLAEDLTDSGVRIAGGRGNIADSGSENYDYWSFSATSGEQLLLASETPGNANGTGLRYELIQPDGERLDYMSSSNGTEQLWATIPFSGTYYVQVRRHYGHTGEYRFRVTLAPSDWEVETEDNGTPAKANLPSFVRSGSLQTAKVLGYVRYKDLGDVFQFRNTQPGTDVPVGDLPVDTGIRMSVEMPDSSTLIPVLEILNHAGDVIASAVEGETELAFTVLEEGRHYGQVRAGSSTTGITAVYLLEMEIDAPEDLESPTILSVSLPAEGTTSTAYVYGFQIDFSEDMAAVGVNDPASYELLNAGEDGVFDTEDDEVYQVAMESPYTSGLSASYVVSDGPLHPGEYRFTIQETVTDLAENPLEEPFVQNFEMENLEHYVLERSGNNSFETGTLLGGEGEGFDGSFAQLSSTELSSNPYSVRSGDLNENGIMDLVVAHRGANTVSVLLGNGDGTFAPAVDYAVGALPTALVLADFDGDSLLDVAVVNTNSNSVSILLNEGNGVLGTAVDYATGNRPQSIAAGDLNEDGRQDLVAGDYQGDSVTVLLGNGDGTFAPGVAISQPSTRPTGVALGDFNGNGHQDLAVANYSTSMISVYPGLGDGTFGTATDYSVLANPAGVAAADLDGDGLVDLVSISSSNSQFNILRARSDGTFDEAMSYTVGGSGTSTEVVLADYTGNGLPDIFITRGSKLSVRQNRGDWTFDESTVYSPGSSVRSVTVADFNGDESPDFATVASGNNHLTVYLGREGHYLPEGPSGDGFRMISGRGAIASNATEDYDFWKFSARAGERIILASENPAHGSYTGLRYELIGPDGRSLNNMADSRGSGQFGQVLPVDGTYAVQVRHNWSYSDEYRFRILLAPAPWQFDDEDNGSMSRANVLALTLKDGIQEGRLFGLLHYSDSADLFSLGNVTAGTELHVGLDQTPLSTFEGKIDILDNDGTTRFSATIDGGSMTPMAVEDETTMNFVYTVESEGTHYVQLTANSGIPGLMADYRLLVDVIDEVPPFITNNTLPAEGTSTLGTVREFQIGFSEDMLVGTVNELGNFELRGAGPDGLFDTGDDILWDLRLTSAYTTGLSADFEVVLGYIQPDSYRFTAKTSLQDRAGNGLVESHVRSFVIGQIPGLATELEPNNSRETATELPMISTQPGLVSGGGRGYLSNNSDVDYWSFEAEDGDIVVVATENPGNPSYSSLQFQIEEADGSALNSFISPHNGPGLSEPNVIPADGLYFVRIKVNHGYSGEHRFRISLYRDGVETELEPNGSIATATPLTISPVEGGQAGAAGGYTVAPGDLDYFSLGTVEAGQTIFLSVRQPQSSPIVPVISLYSASDQYMAEAGSGRPFDGVAQVDITRTGEYYALVRSSGDSAGLMSEYILDALIVPSGGVSFPNLQVTDLTVSGVNGIQSGQSFTVDFEVENVGSQATQVGLWYDQVVLSRNMVFGDEDDIGLHLHERSGALAPGDFYEVTQQVQIPDGISGNFYVIVKTDSTNVVNEFVMEGDNETYTESAFAIQLADYPDLVVENAVLAEPGVEGEYVISWETWNRGLGVVTGGFSERIRVRNLDTNTVVVDETSEVPGDLAPEGFVAGTTGFSVNSAGNYRVEVQTDAADDHFEYNLTGHASAEQNTVFRTFSITALFTIAVEASPAEAGTVTGDGVYSQGASVTVTATPDTSDLPYRFVSWMENGAFRSANSSYTFNVIRDRELTAVFDLPTYFIAVSASPSVGGNITGGGTFAHNAAVSLQAVPQAGYLFSHWSEGGTTISTEPEFSFVAGGARMLTATFTEANPSHVVTTATEPAGIVAVTGAGTFNNGESTTISAPATVVVEDKEYVFEKLTLNGAHFSGNRSVEKTFSTLDLAGMDFVAHYKERSLLPVVVEASGNRPGVVPAGSSYKVTVRFDRSMDPAVQPVATLQGTSETPAPELTAAGSWSRGKLNNDTFTTPEMVFENGHDAVFELNLAEAKDPADREMAAANVFTFTVDATPPTHPVLTISEKGPNSATVTWSDYVAPDDLAAFRIYRNETAFTSTEALAVLTGAGKSSRSYRFTNLELDTEYYVAVAAVDAASNVETTLESVLIRLESDLPPPVAVTLSNQGLDGIQLDWSSYDRDGLTGLTGFRVFSSETAFSTVAGMTPIAELGKTVSKYEAQNLDRSREYYFAVVGYNRLGDFDPEVTSVRWADPLSGSIAGNVSVGGAGAPEIVVHHSITVESGGLLTIQPGTTLRFAAGTGIEIADGALIADGTPLAPIHFTSTKEEGGTAAPGDWTGIRLGAGADNSVLRHVWVRYGDGIRVAGSTPDLKALRLVWNTTGIRFEGVSGLGLESSLVMLNAVGLVLVDNSAVALEDSVVKSNEMNASVWAGSVLNAVGNWWGTANATVIAELLEGNVDATNPLSKEPVLAPAAKAAGGAVRTGSRDLRVLLASPNAVAYRLSEDSTFGGAFFQDMPTDGESDLYTAYPLEVDFELSPNGGMKTVYVQFQSVSGELSPAQSFSVEYVTDGPVIAGFNLAEGAVITRPIEVTGSATAELGVAMIEFLVRDVVVFSEEGAALSDRWNLENMSSGIYRVALRATDTAGRITSREYNVTVQPTPPSAPVISSPGTDHLTNESVVDVAGTAEAFVSVRLTRNGVPVATVPVGADGKFAMSDVSLVEGSNNLIAVAFDEIGSSSSLPVTVERDTGPPVAVVLNEPTFSPADGLALTWTYSPEGKRATRFRLLWSEESFSSVGEASGQSDVGVAMNRTIKDLPTGNYFFAVAGIDNAGNVSGISNLEAVYFDKTAPSFTISYSRASPVGPGQSLTINLTASEPLLAVPMLTLQPDGASSPISVTLTQISQYVYQGNFPVSRLSASSGVAILRVSAKDLVGNSFVGLPSGPELVFDVTRPTGAVTIDRDVPIQVQSDVTMEVGLILSKPTPTGTDPVLSFSAPGGGNVAIALTGEGTAWNGSLTLTPAMGAGFGNFFLETEDVLGNEGSVITEGEKIEIYTSLLPNPSSVPVQLNTVSLPGGEIRVGWGSAEGAEEYSVFRRGDGETETVLVGTALTTNTFTDLPPADGLYYYTITSSRFGSESAASAEIPEFSDRTPPEKPENMTASLAAKGIRIAWDAPSSGETPAGYRVYRNGTVIRSVSAAGGINDSPPRGEIIYEVASVDTIGNESLSEPVILELFVGAVSSFRVTVEDGEAPLLQWNSTDSTAVGVNVYRNGVKRNAAPISGASYQDTLVVGAEPVDYAVRAVNADGQESAGRALAVYPVDFSIAFNPGGEGENQPMRARYFDRYEIGITNLAGAQGLPVQELALSRTSSEGADVVIRKEVNAMVLGGEKLVETVVAPGIQNASGTRTFTLEAVQEVDDGGSQAIYRRAYAYRSISAPGVMMDVATGVPPLAGGLNDFTVTVYNRGYADMDLVIVREGGAKEGDLSIAVLNPQGVEMSRTVFGSVIPNLTFLPDGRGYIRLQPGESQTFIVPSVLIPEALGEDGGATLRAEFAKIYHAIGSSEERISGPLEGAMTSGLTQTAYYGTSSADKAVYADDETAILTGQALDRDTDAPVPNALLHIGIATQGIHWFEEVTTDELGHYEFEYTPTAGLSGTFQVWAAHPDVVDELNQTGFEFYRVYSAPAKATIRMSKNDTLDFTIGLINPGDLELTDFTLEFAAYEVVDGEKVATTALTGTLVKALPLLKVGKARQTVKLRLQAELDSPDNALVEFRFVSAEGAAAVFTGEVSLLAANPLLTVPSPRVGYVQASLDRGDIFSREVTIENRGLRTLEDTVMVLPTEFPWMTVNLEINPDGTVNLPDLEVGETFSFTVVLTPPPGVEQGFYNDTILIRGSNSVSDFELNIFSRITSSQIGSVQFLVDNILVLPVPNATIALRNALLGLEAGPFSTDSEGEVIVPDLMEGDWSWRVTASGHSGSTGIVRVSADEMTTVETRLDRSMVTVNFSVVPVPFTDRYEIKIEQTFQTRVPVPVLVMKPQSTILNVEPGFVGTVMFEVKNEGLISVFDAEVFGKRVDAAQLTPLITYIPEIRAQETIMIPARVEYFGIEEVRDMPAASVLDDYAECYKNFKYGDVTLTSLVRGESSCPDGAVYYPGASATVNVDDLLDILCDGITGKIIGKIVRISDAICKASNIIKGLGCALAQLPEGSITGSPIGGGGGGSNGTWGGGSGSWPTSMAACVTAETLVTLADGSRSRIDQLSVGDQLLSTAGYGNPIAEVRIRENAQIREIHYGAIFGVEQNSLRVTNDHRVWVDGIGWKAALNVEVGDWLHGDDGRLWQVSEISIPEERETVYTLHMEDDGVFFGGGILLEHECGGNPDLMDAFFEAGIEP